MLLSLCRRCNRRLLQASSRLRQLRKGKVSIHGASPFWFSHSASPARRRRLALTLLLLAQTPRTIQSQKPYVYTSRHSAGSTVIGKTLYVVAGTGTGHLPQSYIAITDVISLALDQPFSTTLAPWMSLRPGPAVADARIVPCVEQSHLVLGGMGETGTPLIRVYDIQADTWSPLPPQPIGGNVASPRTSVGIALDHSTGAVIVFGGLVPNTAFSRELDVLDTRPAFNNWTWTPVVPASSFIQLMPLYQPIVLYVPRLQSTLLMGGCDIYSARSVVVSCQTFDAAFQIKTTATSQSLATSPPQKFRLTSAADNNILPLPRSSSCYAVLANGDVFIYGGLAGTTPLSDAWVLSIESWKWTPIKIHNLPAAGRAGATCQLIAHDQVIVIGGYSGANAASREFSEPQIGIINTDSWSWGLEYTPSTASGGLSLGVIIGIVAGSCLMLGVVLFIMGNHLWTKRKTRGSGEEKRVSHSNIPLMDDSVNNSSNSLYTRYPKVVVSTLKFGSQNSSSASSPVSGSWSAKDSRSLPLIIMPYSPTTTSFSTSTFADVSLDAKPASKSGRGNNKRNKGTYNNEVNLPESERLPETMADNQYGQYFKTIQHHKQYEKRLTSLQQQQQNSLGRSDTSTQYTLIHDEVADDHPYLATGMINLREIEMGEESIMVPMQPLETGTILVSGYIDPSSFHHSSSEPVPVLPGSFSQTSTVGVPQPWTLDQNVSLHGKAEALSSESVQSEVLEDYRRRGWP
ncbi:hypothetical protein KVV02_003708 [Mortierella alpina]|uniref:Galactose oxidase n=1 Tax=Mortierella alpina TaxID=64518 RepID=A0A9P8A8L1_MORAP|nr:hypothetical protein KVV02_003708 [Mortierella alpina]